MLTETALPIRREPASIVYAEACKKPKRTRGDNTDTFLSVCLSVNVYRAGIAIQMGNQASCNGCDAFAPSAALVVSRRPTNTGSLPALRLLTNFHSWETALPSRPDHPSRDPPFLAFPLLPARLVSYAAPFGLGPYVPPIRSLAPPPWSPCCCFNL